MATTFQFCRENLGGYIAQCSSRPDVEADTRGLFVAKLDSRLVIPFGKLDGAGQIPEAGTVPRRPGIVQYELPRYRPCALRGEQLRGPFVTHSVKRELRKGQRCNMPATGLVPNIGKGLADIERFLRVGNTAAKVRNQRHGWGMLGLGLRHSSVGG